MDPRRIVEDDRHGHLGDARDANPFRRVGLDPAFFVRPLEEMRACQERLGCGVRPSSAREHERPHVELPIAPGYPVREH